MLEHTSEAKLNGQAAKPAIDFIAETLMGHNFLIEHRSETALEASGPGMNSTRQSPILGASRVRVEAQGDALSMRAELGAVQRMRQFITWFPPMLGVGLAVFFIALGTALDIRLLQRWASLAAVLAVLPWPIFLSPWMSRKITDQTRRALENLLRNAASEAGHG
jgi:hypothetical protein